LPPAGPDDEEEPEHPHTPKAVKMAIEMRVLRLVGTDEIPFFIAVTGANIFARAKGQM
jgi:hypothetical protein